VFLVFQFFAVDFFFVASACAYDRLVPQVAYNVLIGR